MCLVAPSASAQTETPAPIHWAYGAYFGTGRYELADGQSTYVLSARPSRRLRAAQFNDDETRSIGIELRFPVAVGTHRFDIAGSSLQFDNVSTVSVVPGVEIDVPITARWSLKPIAYVGWGTEVSGDSSGDSSAWLYWTGVKSQVRFAAGALNWAMVNSLTYVGYSSDDEDASVLPLFTGFEFETPLQNTKIANELVHLHWHVGYTSYLNEIDLRPARTSLSPVTIDDEWELGVAFSTGQQPLRLWRLKWDRVGIAYRFSSDGEFEGLSLTFRSLFER